MTYLLDTHVLIEWMEGARSFAPSHRRIVRRATPSEPLRLSDISMWEIATLHERGRIRLDLPLRDWLERAAADGRVERVGITPVIAAEMAAMPITMRWDPADRIIVATARVLGATLLTLDTRIIEAGLVRTV